MSAPATRAEPGNGPIGAGIRVYRHAGKSLIALLVLVLLTGLTELIGIAMFVPLLSVVADSSSIDNPIVESTARVLGALNIELSLPAVVLLICVIFIAKAVLTFIQFVATGLIVERLKVRLRSSILEEISRAPYERVTRHDTGYLTNLVTTEVEKLAAAVGVYIHMLAMGIWASVFLIGALSLGPLVTLILIAIWVLIFVGLRKPNSAIRELSLALSDADGALKHLLVQGIASYKYLKTTSSFDRILRHTRDRIERVANVMIRIVVLRTAIRSALEPTGIILILALTYFRTGIQGRELAETLALVLFMHRIYRYGSDMQLDWNNFNSSVGGLLTFDNYRRELHATAPSDEDTPSVDFESTIELVDATLSLEGRPVLNGVSLTIRRNQTVALVGRSGGGKTTIVDTILGLYDCASGEVRIDDRPTSAAERRNLSARIGYVTQDPIIFDDTILENVAFYDTGVTEAEKTAKVLESAALAGCDFVRPDGSNLEQKVGDRGLRLSGGQRQRLAIARELYRRPEILVLDEATSALDTKTERALQESIRRLHGQFTMIVIAHRLSTIREADIIYVVDQGKVVERGRFADLAQRQGGEFASQYKQQVE